MSAGADERGPCPFRNSRTLVLGLLALCAAVPAHATKALPGYSTLLPPEHMANVDEASCTATQTQTIEEAVRGARVIVGKAITDMSGAPVELRHAAPRTDWWLGEYAASRYDDVLKGYRAMDALLENDRIAFDCSCDRSGVYAYTFASRLDVYLCPVFWVVPVLGTDSRAGTLVHELSHLNAVFGTRDEAHGQLAARNLAVRDPAAASKNADSWEYLAENTPESDMPEAPEPERDSFMNPFEPVEGSASDDDPLSPSGGGAAGGGGAACWVLAALGALLGRRRRTAATESPQGIGCLEETP